MADVCFFSNRKYLYLSRALSYTDEIRFPGILVDLLVNQSKTGSKIAPLLPPS